MKRCWWCCSLLILSAGCGGSEPSEKPEKPFAGRTVRVGVVGDAGLLTAISAQSGEWSAETSATLSIAERPIEIDKVSEYDVVVFSGESTGELVDRGLLTVWAETSLEPAARVIEGEAPAPSEAGEESGDSFEFKDIIAAYRDQVTKYGSDRVSLPIGGTGLVLAYHRVALESPTILEAARAAGIVLEVPKTWEEFDRIVAFLHGRDWSGDGKPDSGVALAWGADTEGIAVATYLARAAALGQHRDQYSFLFETDALRPRITSPPFLEALVAHNALAKFAPSNPADLDIVAARKAFRDGKVAFLIDRAEAIAQWNGEKPAPVGVAQLPGSMRVYDPSRKEWETLSRANRPSLLPSGGGVVVGVVAAGAQREAAENYARYLAGPSTSNRIRSDRECPMLATRNAQLGQGIADPRSAPGVDPRGWAVAVGSTMNAVRVVVGLRIPGASGYLADLSAGRLAALGGAAPEKALADVAERWDARTEALGRERQLWHYRRSLNNLVTTPEPPARPSK